MPSSLRILVIDDDPVMRELLEALLGFAGHRVTVVDSGIAALRLLETPTGPLDVVLTDLHMPVLQGKELAACLLAARAPGTIVIGMSGSAPNEEETHLLDEFLHKPFTPEQFEHAVDRVRSSANVTAASVAPERDVPEPVLDETIFTRLAATVSPDQLRGLYTLTLDDVLQRVDRMAASMAAGDAESVHREAHAIKGGCGMVGARQLYALAASVETAPVTASLPLENFTLACHRLKRMLDERLTF